MGGFGETPTFGGAIAGGAGAAAKAVSGQGGSPATGFAPVPAAVPTFAGALAQGRTAAARASVTPGGAIAGGLEPIPFLPGAIIYTDPFDYSSGTGIATSSPTTPEYDYTGPVGIATSAPSSGAFDYPDPIGETE
jgi:hypothetical protein